MERRLALAAAGAAAATFGIGTVCFAALGGTDILGLTATGTLSIAPAAAPKTITRVVVVVGPDGAPIGTEVVTETVPIEAAAADTAPADVAPESTAAVALPTDPAASTAATSPIGASPNQNLSWSPYAPKPTTTVATKVTVTTVAAAKPTPLTTRVTVPAPATTVAITSPTTAPPVVTTTTAAAPTSTLPRGVPADWPAGKPIPPKPPNCVKGQLEDNGVWNCEH
jgi:hypothetical protein